jgi:AcrR family transcriptional regulator
VKTWTDDNPKAELMLRKRTAIVDAARRCFLDGGYAQTSMDRIAQAAEVSVKTVYRHFQNKDDLFSAVMQAACANPPDAAGVASPAHPWFEQPPALALPLAGAEYLRHALSPEQLALYRVVTRDAEGFPELGRRYQEETVGKRNQVFAQYLERWRDSERWTLRAPERASEVFAALLRAGIFEPALHGVHLATEAELARQAGTASAWMLQLLGAGCL